MESRSIKGVPHHVFDNFQEFFDFHSGNPPDIVSDWRNSNIGDWVMSDDGRIVQILRVGGSAKNCKNSANRKNGQQWAYVGTVVGTYPTGYRSYMDTDFSKHKDRYKFGGKRDGRIYGETRNYLTKHEKRFLFNVLAQMIHGGEVDPTKAYQDIDGCSEKTAFMKSHRLLRNPHFVKELTMIARDTCDNHGLTDEYLIQKHKEIIDNTEDERLKLDAIKEGYKLRDSYPKETNTRGKFLGWVNETGAHRQIEDADAVALLEEHDSFALMESDGIEEEE